MLICHAAAINTRKTWFMIYYVILLACGICTCILVTLLEKPLCITSTSFIGSYLLVRGVSLFVGGYPNEFEVSELIKHQIKPWTQYKWFWAYLAAFFVVFVLSIVCQCFITKATTKENESS